MSGMTMAEALAIIYTLNHTNALEAVVDLDEEKLRWRPPRSNSVAFNIWHIARWADHFQSILSTMTPTLRERVGPTPEVWARAGFAAKWGFLESELGTVQTGMGMDEDVSAKLALPGKDELLSYVKDAFRSADRAVRMVRDDDLTQPAELEADRVPWLSSPTQYGTVGSWIATGIRHEARHLGMIEALKGAAGLRGTATR
ncbi:MAG: DinB family protein [Chloroflexi bacterium]|nr:MAG: DinB family protein [Chloroflexota bacterium]